MSGAASGSRPIKVMIVGGGCAAVSAAFELTRPEHGGKYAVTIYQLGWRLGGKGASGRGPADRIEEHGLHLWMGYYENAFRLMRECYAELKRDASSCPIADWRDAFEPAPLAAVAERAPDGRWVPWIARLGQDGDWPGDPYPAAPGWSVGEYTARLMGLVRALFESLETRAGGAGREGGQGTGQGAFSAEVALERVSRLLRYGELATLAALVEAAKLLETVLGSGPDRRENLVARVVDALATNARGQLEALAATDVELRRLWIIADLALATLRGIFRFGLLSDPRGFDAIDEYDGREWLLLNGASQMAVNSAYMRGLYDLGFSYEDGDVSRPRASAGQALRSWFRAFFTYRGSFFWKMRAGMGDVVFAPFYQVLRARGVRFEFFHRLENVRLVEPSRLAEGEPPYVEALEFDVQAEVKHEQEYRPLIDVRGLPCWPSAPLYDQLVDGDRLRFEGWNFESHWQRPAARRKTLRVVADFDLVVLGVGLGAIPHVCREIVGRDPRWRAMVDQVKTVATQAFQIWLNADMEGLGWRHPPVTLSGFVEPFDTWADMGHLIAWESWQRSPRALAYFCSVLPDPEDAGDRAQADYAAKQAERVRENAITFLDRHVPYLWPDAASKSGGFRWDLLVGPEDAGGARQGEARFVSQYWRANVNPSDRYTLSLPGTSAYRISPLDETYDNLTIAGDWTDCGFNVGCVEAAVMSGRLAAHAISKSPPLEDIIGYDHP